MAENLSYNPYRDMHDEVQFSAMFFGKTSKIFHFSILHKLLKPRGFATLLNASLLPGKKETQKQAFPTSEHGIMIRIF